jgi:uncharacterized protein (DUF58 family)
LSSARIIPAGRQGPGRLPPAVIARLEHKLRRRTAGALPGEHLTPGAGDGLELAQLRLYEPGDDVRRLDPAASARTGEPHVRLQVPERAVTTWIVLDVSASMAFGTQGRLKSDVAEGVADVVARVGVRRGGRVALVVAGGEQPRLLPPRPGRGALASLRALVQEGVESDAAGAPPRQASRAPETTGSNRTSGVRFEPHTGREGVQGSEDRAAAGSWSVSLPRSVRRRAAEPTGAAAAGGPSPLAAALTRVGRVARSSGVLVIVSDFRDEGWAAALRAAGARHTVLAVEICDPAEAELPAAGLLTLVDPESGRLVEADTNAPGLRDAYAKADARRRATVAAALRAASADHLVLSTERDWLRDLGRRMS